MPWSVDYNRSLGIIEEVFSGLVTTLELRAATSRRISLQKETGIFKILNDVSGVVTDANILEVHDFPDKQYSDESADRKTRMALVMPTRKRERELADFFMTASRNRGWVVATFEDRQRAIDWLASMNAT